MDSRRQIEENGYRVALLCGGGGSEHEVSLVSGESVQGTLDTLGIPCERHFLERPGLPKTLRPERDLVLPLIHGRYGEDGRLSAELDAGGFAYAGSDQASSALCFDKLACKAVAVHAGLPVARDQLLLNGEPPSYAALRAQLNEPLILKPRFDGSSVGLFIVDSEESYQEALKGTVAVDYLAEDYVEGIDLTVGILDGEPLGVVAVHPEGGLYDYAHKYTSGLTRYEVPARLDETLRKELYGWSRQLFRICGCRDFGRIDFRLGREGMIVFLEINTLPGMTPTSLLPKTASCSGIGFEDLVLRFVTRALERMQAGGAE
ncbi:MAG TPA: D-alanine--D-alanine ligase [Oceanipulchritudo sp.]|nr:D-alanine--D-alanine ligase [Oceanipulchritudo sp.]